MNSLTAVFQDFKHTEPETGQIVGHRAYSDEEPEVTMVQILKVDGNFHEVLVHMPPDVFQDYFDFCLEENNGEMDLTIKTRVAMQRQFERKQGFFASYQLV